MGPDLPSRYGYLPAKTDFRIVHFYSAADRDVGRHANRPVEGQWQLIKMRTAPLIRLELVILDDAVHPYLFESFLNVAEADQARVLTRLIRQDRLYLAFYGDHLEDRFTKTIHHGAQQRQQLAELIQEAIVHWAEIPAHQRDYDRAKQELMRRYTSAWDQTHYLDEERTPFPLSDARPSLGPLELA